MSTTKSYVRFEEAATSRRTLIFNVRGVHDDLLGCVAWFGRWRQYTFQPSTDTVYSAGCLREIMDFVALQNTEHALAIIRRKNRRSAYGV